VLRSVQCLSANDRSFNLPDDTRTQSLDHPRIGVFVGDGIGGREAETAGRLEPVARVVSRMSKDEDQIHPRFGEYPYASFDQLAADSLVLKVRHDGQWSQQCDGDCFRVLFEPGGSEQDVANGALTFECKEGEARQGSGVVQQSADEFSLLVVAERGAFHVQNVL